MKRILLIPVFYFISMTFSYGAVELLVDSLTSSTNDAPVVVSTTTHAIAQKFTTGSAVGGYDLDTSSGGSVSVFVGGGAGTEVISLAIHADSSGDPAGSAITNGTFMETSAPSTAASTDFTLATPAHMDPTTPYWLVYTYVSDGISITWVGDDDGLPAPAGTAMLSDVKVFTGTWSGAIPVGYLNVIINADAIPEPQTWAMIFASLGAVASVQYRRRRQFA